MRGSQYAAKHGDRRATQYTHIKGIADLHATQYTHIKGIADLRQLLLETDRYTKYIDIYM